MWIDIEQNTPEWFALRAGKVTGSSIAKVMANWPNAFGQPAKDLAVSVAVERLTGNSIANLYTNTYMERGHEMEPIAKDRYMQRKGIAVSHGGFYDNGNTGCSPDGICEDGGIIEVKTAIPNVHYKRLHKKTYDAQYRWQLLFNLRESNAEYIDFVSYCPEFPRPKQLFIYRVFREQAAEALKKMEQRLAKFECLVTRIQQEIEA